jgi:hypothetical protein
MENTSFMGPKLIIDAEKQVKIVTQFFAKDRTDNDQLSEIKRKYVQGGKAIETKLLIFQSIPLQVNSAMNRNQNLLILMTLRRKVNCQNL